ncbi:hypothetical protein [Actinokineospora pegani]|uniref:hypothetical protein n=1 Tax=Actinokineospora pegani TaxID=2654637 RepID=UPI001F1E0530|nr:hypothetical protein [Actinokineospora pegani]
MFDTVEGLAGAVTAVLSPDGPLANLAQTLTDALDSVWAEFFVTPTPPGGTNWNAYSHEQLHGMLWQDADVGDVGTVAAEWGRHSTELTGFADALRREAEALRANWRSPSSGQAADRLAELSDRVWNAGARAGTVQKAAAEAGDALAVARNTMPPPTPDPMTLATSAVGAGPINPVAAVLIGGARFFTADAVAGVAKAQAVGVMRTYESSLHASSHQVVPGMPSAGGPRSYEVDGSGGGTTTAAAAASTPGGPGSTAGRGGAGGVPWSRLVGGSAPGAAGGAGLDAGRLVGGGPGPVGSVLAAERAALSNLAAARGAGPGGLMGAPMGARPMGEQEGRDHRSRLPNVDTGIFTIDERASAAVIGGAPDREDDHAFE